MKLNPPIRLVALLAPLLLCLSNVGAANIQVGDDTSMIVPIADKTLKAQLFQATRGMNND